MATHQCPLGIATLFIAFLINTSWAKSENSLPGKFFLCSFLNHFLGNLFSLDVTCSQPLGFLYIIP